jgi:hypothetical protein
MLILATLVLAAGCGSGSEAAPNPYPDDPALVERVTTDAQRAALARAAQDVAVMKRAAAKSPSRSLKGTPAERKATARFLEHVQRSPLDNLTQNRLIDHAAASVSFSCEQCFQQLEASRPIPAIAHP